MQTRLTVLRLVYGIQTRIKSHLNDETLLVVESPKFAAHFTREMNQMWGGDASRGSRSAVGVKLSRENGC